MASEDFGQSRFVLVRRASDEMSARESKHRGCFYKSTRKATDEKDEL
jgi:hypothetical protein